MLPVMLKVCCIATETEARMAIAAGATAVGLVGDMPSGPGIISDDKIQIISRAVKDDAWTVLLTSRTSAKDIADHVTLCGVNTVQIVDKPEPGTYDYLRQALPALRIIQVIHVENDSAIDHTVKVASSVDVILLDSGKPTAKTKILGGTGQSHNWSISKRIVEAVKVPVFLAGGIRAGNVAKAITVVRPAGVDLCTGVRENDMLSQAKLSALTANILDSNDQ